ncbi:MAG: hypothetical protein KBA51_06670 [Kiritimatiellae bacterium]|nr:hypothetical protein [Kiritimatiellia bacterium]
MRRAPSRGWTKPGARHPKVGQALMEFVAALVIVVILVAALLQVAALSRERLRALQGARARVASVALADEYPTLSPGPGLLAGWTTGADGRPMSADDRAVGSAPDRLREDVLSLAGPMPLNLLAPGNPVSRAAMEDPMVDAFHLIRGTEQSDPVILIPIVRRLLYRADEITVEADATGVWLKGVE